MFINNRAARSRHSTEKYVLAFGGGGARGLAHIGVLKVFQREGFKITGIAGTSMGAIAGAMFAYYDDAIEVEGLFRKFLTSRFHEKFGKTFFVLSENPETYHEPKKIIKELGRSYTYLKAASRNAVFSREILKDILEFLLPDVDFKNMRIPFICVSTDLVTGKEIVFKRGRLIPAVIASCSIPGIVEPMKIGDSLLVDGSTISMVPVAAARKTFSDSENKVIAIDVSMELKRDTEPATAFEVALRSAEISNHYLNRVSLDKADFVIHPKVGRANWANFDKLDELIRSGETAARKFLLDFINRR
ncbi:MAG: patatin-like phospholipase family protein [Candidatus Kryptoniota bacterium]